MGNAMNSIQKRDFSMKLTKLTLSWNVKYFPRKYSWAHNIFIVMEKFFNLSTMHDFWNLSLSKWDNGTTRLSTMLENSHLTIWVFSHGVYFSLILLSLPHLVSHRCSEICAII